MPVPTYITQSLKALSDAEPAYTEALSFYEGTVPELFTSDKLRDLFGTIAQGFHINFARTPVDVMMERTQVNGILCEDDTARELLNQVWEDNELDLEVNELHQMVYVFGECAVIAWPDEDLDGGVSIYAHDPRSVRVFYDPERPRVKTHAVHTWREGADNGDVYQRINVYFPDRVEQWISRTPIESVHGVTPVRELEWDLYATDEATDGVIDNPFGVIPVFHFRNERPYGRPEHKDAYSPQNVINKTIINMMAALDYQGAPQRYALTDSALENGGETGGDAFTPPSAQDSYTPDTYNDGLPEGQMKAGPGEVWLLSGTNLKVGQFSTADSKNFLEPLRDAVKMMASVCDLPAYYFDRTGQMPSGESFRRSESSLNKKMSNRHNVLSRSWSEVFNFVLLVNGIEGPTATISWAPPEVRSDTDSWSTAKTQLEAGVPREVVLLERGYTQEDIDGWQTPVEPVVPSEQ